MVNDKRKKFMNRISSAKSYAPKGWRNDVRTACNGRRINSRVLHIMRFAQ